MKKYILNYTAMIISLAMAAYYMINNYVLMTGIFLILACLIQIMTMQEKLEDKVSRWLDE